MNFHPAKIAVVITSRDQDNDSFGSGFIIRIKEGVVQVVTCTHVLDNVGGPEWVLVNGNPPQNCVPIKSKGIDLVLLKLEGLEGLEGLKPLRLQVLEAAGTVGYKFSLVGYSRPVTGDPPRARDLSGRLGKASEQPLSDPSGAITYWDICIEDGDDKLEAGYSGSPIIDPALGGVIAIASHRLGQGEKGYAFSVDALRPLLLQEGLEELLPPPRTVPQPQDTLKVLQHYVLPIQKSLTLGFGDLIPVLGPGVGLADGNPISVMKMASTFGEKSEIICENQEDLIGVPCSVCPLKLQQWAAGSIPDDCPILQRIRQDSDSGSIPELSHSGLSREQQLVLAKVNLRLKAQLYDLTYGEEYLYPELHRIYDRDLNDHRDRGDLNPVYRFLAQLQDKLKLLPKTIYSGRLPFKIILTTNIDEGLEEAFREHRQPYDLLYYVASGSDSGFFRYQEWETIQRGPGWEQAPSDQQDNGVRAGTDTPLKLGERPLIVKLFGTWSDKFAIAESHFVNYLSRLPAKDVLPIQLLEALNNNNNKLLLLGFSLGDPDLELILQRFRQTEQSKQGIAGTFYIVHQSRPGALERRLWKGRNVQMSDDPFMHSEQCICASLGDYILALEASIADLEKSSPSRA